MATLTNTHGYLCKDGDTHSHAVPPIAIIGMGMRLPGNVRTGDEFWGLLISQRDCSSEVPKSRYNVDAFYHPDKPQSVKTRRGYFLDDDYLQKADQSFFEPIPGLNVADLDPQQMSLMEVVWECMENAGQTGWRGKKIGCYVGVFGEDWHEQTAKESQAIPRVHAFANGSFALSNRVSFEFDLKGPSATIHTACSSSLMALHEACQSLYTGSCSAAIVAGTNMLLNPSMTVNMSENGVLSPDGRCKVFDANANGYARGEAVNAILIKPLDQAIVDGDKVRAIIRSTSANYDGKTAKIFAPDVESQERLIREAYMRANIHDISQTAFVECHGTGTKVGDLVEATAIARVFGGKGVLIGSVKSNIGHGEGASGLSGVIKAVLSLEHHVIPPNMHFSHPNPKIPFQAGNLRVPVQPTPWPSDRLARVSVNCFGIGGNNAHVILDSASATNLMPQKRIERAMYAHIVPVSAQSQEALGNRLIDIKRYLQERPQDIQDVAYTLGAHRDHLSHRGYLLSGSTGSVSSVQFNASAVSKEPSLVFTFTGQGAHWDSMGKDLFNCFETFRRDICIMDQVLQELELHPTWKIEVEIQKSEISSFIDATEYSQTMCAAIQIALVNLFSSWGIHPSAVVGYSSGEVIAAYAANAISMRTAITVAYYRGRCLEHVSRNGAMAMVGLGKEEIARFLTDGVFIACENSPNSVNISGDKPKVMAVCSNVVKEKPETIIRHLPFEIAYHSPHMEKAASAFETNIASHLGSRVDQRHLILPFYSTVTGRLQSDAKALDASYWRESLVSPVLFSTALRTLLKERDGHSTIVFIEIGCHPTLSGFIRQTQSAQALENPYVPTLRKNTDQVGCVLKAVGELFSYRCSIDFSTIHPGKLLTGLPNYPWDRKKFNWRESRLSRNWRFRKHHHHELLGSCMLEATDIEPSWRNLMGLSTVPWIKDHRVSGEVVFPCAGYIAMINEATRQQYNTQHCTIRNLHIKIPLILPTSGLNVEIITTMRRMRINDRLDSDWHEFTISSHDGANWTNHAVGQAFAGFASMKNLTMSAAVPQKFSRSVSSPFWYDQLSKLGLQYGSSFQGLQDITADPVSHTASASISGTFEGFEYNNSLHPTMIDQCLQLFSVAACRGKAIHLRDLLVPVFIDEVYLKESQPFLKAEVTTSRLSGIQGQGNAALMSDDHLVLSMKGVRLARMPQRKKTEAAGVPLLSHCEWLPALDFLPSHPQLPGTNIHKNTAEVLVKVSRFFMSQLHQHVCRPNVASQIPRFKAWPEAAIDQAKNQASLFVPNAQDPAYDNGPRGKWLLLEQQLKDSNLDFISQLYQQALAEVPLTTEDEKNPTCFGKKNDPYQKLQDWISSTYDLSEWLFLLGHSNPRLRILEIGAGKGSFSSNILQRLTRDGAPLCSLYVATDTLQVANALKERLQRYENVEFQTLDLNHDLSAQGFDHSNYDLVIVSKIDSRVASLGDALRAVRKLLAPGGRLLLHEMCSALSVVDNLLDASHTGPFDESVLDLDSKPMSSKFWNSELLKAGFVGIEVDTYNGEMSNYLSRTLISSVPLQDHLHDSTVYLLCHDKMSSHAWIEQVEDHFFQHGIRTQRLLTSDQIQPKQHIISLLDLDSPFFSHISEKNWKALQQLIENFHQILWVTELVEFDCENPDFSLVMGVSRTARQEQEVAFGTFQVDNFDSVTAEALLKISRRFFKAKDRSGLVDMDYEFALHHGTIYIPRVQWSSLADRLLQDADIKSPIKLEIESYGTLDSMHWAEDISTQLPSENEIEVDVQFVGLNFRDVMIALGVMANKDELGIEASGTVQQCGPGVSRFKPGDRVMIMKTGLLRTRTVLHTSQCVLIPSELSLEDAASMATVYTTAVYCLLDVGRLEAGQSILIHAACGGVGLAAMQVCRMMGAKVYATVGSAEKADYITRNHSLSSDCIFSSRDTSFFPALMAKTKGRGVDIVLNSLAGELLHASWKCVAEFGKMIEIGKRDFLEHGTLSLEEFGGNRAFFGVDLIRLAQKPGLLKKLVDQVMKFYEQGKISPVRPLNVIEGVNIHKAFRSLQRGLNIGKIVVKMPGTSERSLIAKSRRRAQFSPKLSYILVGGLGGVGRAIATWMIEQGARNLTFLSRSAGSTIQDQSFRRELEILGCHVVMAKGSVTNVDDVRDAIKASPCHIGGVLQLSMALRDQFIPDMSHNNWEDGITAKVDGTWNLHHALNGQDDYVQFFVLCGSITGVMGNAGQVNYSAANTFVSSFAQYRLQNGLPASVVNLGAVDDVGFLATQDLKLRERMRSASVRLLSEEEVLDAFELAILCGHAKEAKHTCNNRQTPLRVSNNFIVGMSSRKSLTDPSVRSLWGQDARFRAYGKFDTRLETSQDLIKDGFSLHQMISAVEKSPEVLNDPSRENEVIVQIVKTVQVYSNFAPGLDYAQVAAMHIDSLMTVEIRNWSRRYLDMDLPLTSIAKVGTIEGLGKLIIDVLRSKYQKE